MNTLSSPALSVGEDAQQRKAIQALTGRFAQAMNSYDAALLTACFTADADFTNVQGKRIQGSAEIQQAHEPLFTWPQLPGVPSFYNSVFEVQSLAVRFIKPDVAAIDLLWNQSGATGPDGQPWPPRKGLIDAVAVEEDGNWLFVVLYNRVL